MEEELQGQRDIAVEILIKAGVLARCPIHEDIIIAGGADIEDAYKLGNSLFTNDKDEWELQHDFRDRREKTDTIKEMFEWHCGGADECGLCMKDD